MSKLNFKLPTGTVVPNHIAIILDGNRRWARSRGLSPWEGHKAGAKAIMETLEASRKLGIHTLTVWGFSTENWERPEREITEIMNLVSKYLDVVKKESHKNKIKFIHLGRKDRLSKIVLSKILELEKSTKNYKAHTLNLALDYGGKDEILRAVRKIVDSKVSSEAIDQKLFESYLDTAGQPYPYVDLFIRTGGEQRTSGLMPWQMEYAEFYFEPVHLPDFTPDKLRDAVLDYSRRRRRFGGNDAVEHFRFKPELAAKFELAWWRLSKIPAGTKFSEYAFKHLKELYGLSKTYSKEAAKLMLQASISENKDKWKEAKVQLKKFYKLIKDEVKLAFEPEIVASLELKLRREIGGKNSVNEIGEAEEIAKKLYAEVYRISLFQAAKLAHLRVLAAYERSLAERGFGDDHWDRAQDYLEKFYTALKERVA